MKYFIANWKMYLSRADALALSKILCTSAFAEGVQAVVCPSFVHIDAVGAVLRFASGGAGAGMGGFANAVGGDSLYIALGAQDAYFEASGAYTGAVSIQQLKELGVSYALVGHSEHRHYFGETDDMVNKKVHAVYSAGLQPIICVGETAEARAEGKTQEIVSAQVQAALNGVAEEVHLENSAASSRTVIIAYEPIWAIGTGVTPKVEDARAVHQYIKQIVQKETGAKCHVLYGGSVTPENMQMFWNAPDIDGVLVGGASAHKDTLTSLLALLSN